MDRLTEMEAFVRVVDHGGFTEAARKMGLSKSAVSKHVAALEARLAVRLLNRTTRRVSPTELGLAYYDRARGVLAGALEADAMVTSMQDAPRGSLRVSVPVSFGIARLATAVPLFLRACPEVDVNLVLDDRFVEVIAEGFDLAVRIGALEDSSLKARKLAEARRVLVAAPDYVAGMGAPKSLDDLGEHRLLHSSNLATGNFWRLRGAGGEERHIRVGGRLTANNADVLLHAAEAGLGIALLPSFILGDALEAGRLVEILPGRAPDLMGVWALYPPGRYPQPKLRAFVDFLAEHFRGRGPDRW
ncbi:LysR family transcriptional regulator [Amaricoccus sp.]|uniref:LysR family transcriptional regulator n=1 Tax=Amaricoccus sp. TaxID=1872485 RepID=UPI001B5AF8FA|nr:LysR family transcriptional regulator [Amaricoccus sp.]MBP7000560.1 LysR family transcriptional regulator [Amaricoccus sp.]